MTQQHEAGLVPGEDVVRAFAAWHPKRGIDIGTLRETPGRCSGQLTAEQIFSHDWEIVPVEIRKAAHD